MVAIEVMKRLETMKIGMTKDTLASALLSTVLNWSWLITIPQLGEATQKSGTESDNEKTRTIRQPQQAFSYTPDTTFASPLIMTTLKSLVQKELNDMARLK